MADNECETVRGAAEIARHLRAAHGCVYGPEWRTRIVHGYGYEFERWHEDLKGKGETK